jgi:hypothetical protein
VEIIRDGQIFALYLFDVAEAIDLRSAAAQVAGSVRAKLEPKPPTPAYVQYQEPPLWFDGAAVEIPTIEGFRAGFKVFDYGVILVRLSRPFTGSWGDLAKAGEALLDNEALERQAEQACRGLAQRLSSALVKPRRTPISEDYVLFAVHELDRPHTAEEMMDAHGDVIAGVLRGELLRLSRQERDEVLSHRISYLNDDLVIPTWNAAFVYDTAPGTLATLEIFEFANSQLLQFRYYDDLLDGQLARIYADLQVRRAYDWVFGGHYMRAARQIHTLFIDVNELTDRTENALKIVGDVYAARLFTLVAARLDLNRWKTNVGEKLKTLDDIYRFSVERVSMARGQFLELTIVLLIIFEIFLYFGNG